jgi:hypothetical protein
MGETGTTTFKGVTLRDAAREVIAEIESVRPHNYSPASIGAVVDSLYPGAWWRSDLITAVERELY